MKKQNMKGKNNQERIFSEYKKKKKRKKGKNNQERSELTLQTRIHYCLKWPRYVQANNKNFSSNSKIMEGMRFKKFLMK